MVEDLEDLLVEYKESEDYLQDMLRSIQQYLNDIESIKNAITDFQNYCNCLRNENKSAFNIRKKYAEKHEEVNWINYVNIIKDLKGTHYFTYVKTHVKAFEGMSKQFRTKIDNI